jgi:hypothetical protein
MYIFIPVTHARHTHTCPAEHLYLRQQSGQADILRTYFTRLCVFSWARFIAQLRHNWSVRFVVVSNTNNFNYYCSLSLCEYNLLMFVLLDFSVKMPLGHSPRAKRTARQLLLLSIYNENASERASSHTGVETFSVEKSGALLCCLTFC